MAKGRFTGGGSRLGTKNKHPRAFKDQLRQYCASVGVDPFHYMADLIVNDDLVAVGVDDQGQCLMAPLVPIAIKFQCAKELAAYLEPKLRTVEVTGSTEHHMHFTVEVKTTLAEALQRSYNDAERRANGHALSQPLLPVPRS